MALLVIPYLLAVMLKTGILEHPLPDGMSTGDFVYEVYIRPMWLEITVIALALVVGDMIGESNWLSKKVLVAVMFLFGAFMVSLILVTFLPAIGVTGDGFTLWLPIAITFGAGGLVVGSLTPK